MVLSGFVGAAPRAGGRPAVARILPELLIGEYPTPDDAAWLRSEHGVTAVVSLQDDADLACKNLRLSALERAYREHGLRFHREPLPDGDGEVLAARLDPLVALLARLLDAGERVYLHCNAGLNRAPTVAIAYLLACRDLALAEASALVKERRACVPYRRVLEAWAAARTPRT
jgi:hypothetical protein